MRREQTQRRPFLDTVVDTLHSLSKYVSGHREDQVPPLPTETPAEGYARLCWMGALMHRPNCSYILVECAGTGQPRYLRQTEEGQQ